MSGELLRALGALAEPPRPETERIARVLGLPLPRADDYTELFVIQLAPYASVYLGGDGMIGGEARDRVLGFWHALGRTPPAEPDHLASLLGLYAALADREAVGSAAAQRAGHARRALLWEHLSSWLPLYLKKVREIGGGPYATWARLLGETLVSEESRASLSLPLPLHLREAPDLPDPESAPLGGILGALLAPVTSGILITQRDIDRLARDLDLGLRRGERRFALRALFDQDAGRVLGLLERHASFHVEPRPRGAIARFWSERAAGTVRFLATMRLAAEQVSPGGFRLR